MRKIINNLYLRLTVFLLLLFGLSACQQPTEKTQAEEETKRPPNIVYILVDDMGYGDLSCYGQQTLSTPNIDQLAKEGMRFTQHYAGNTVCAPSRSALLTGKHTGHCSVRGNMPEGQLTREEEKTVAEVLKDQGYATAVIGKWGVGHPPPPDDPLRHGFDHHYGYINMWHAHNFYPEFLYKDGKKVDLPGNVTDTSYDYDPDMPEGTGVAKEKETYVLFEFENDAMQFMEDHKEQPFFLYLALNMPHANNEAGYFTGDGMEVPDYGAFADKDWPQPEKGFAQMMHLIDQSVAKMVNKVKELGLDEETLIIFASDNGPHEEGGHKVAYFNSNGSLRGQKRDLYEGGVRVPMIARWPGKIAASTTSDHISAFWDVLPTFCELSGAEIPANIDGISFLPSLTGKTEQQQQHEYLYWEFYELGGRQAVRQGDWKYVKLNVRDEQLDVVSELYNLKSDLAETNNLIDQQPEKVAEMEALLKKAHTPSPLLSLFSQEKNAETRY